eukprot:scaffold3570_cov318-Prasinococcus_capsulatus_cf.AAC.2
MALAIGAIRASRGSYTFCQAGGAHRSAPSASAWRSVSPEVFGPIVTATTSFATWVHVKTPATLSVSRYCIDSCKPCKRHNI